MPHITVEAAKLQALTAEFSGLVTMRAAHETIDAAEQSHKDTIRLPMGGHGGYRRHSDRDAPQHLVKELAEGVTRDQVR